VSPRPQIAHLRRSQILTAAGEVIRERGVSRTRIADVAERMGVSPPALLYYFESKQELLGQALTFAEECFYDEFADELSSIESARDRLIWLVDSYIAADDYDVALWIELWPHALRGGELAETRDSLDRRWREAIASIIRDGQRRGEFGGGDPHELALLVASLLDGLAIQVALGDREISSRRARELSLGMLERELACELTAGTQERRRAA
jgi:AcrR family transcriptional regulator